MIDDNGGVVDDLIQELSYKSRPISDVEDALLLHRQIDLRNALERTSRDIEDALKLGNEDQAASLRIQPGRLLDSLVDLEEAVRVGGTETGRGLNARKMMAAQDFSLAKMLTDKRIANVGKKLTPEEMAAKEKETKEIHDKIVETDPANIVSETTHKETRERVAKEAAQEKAAGTERDLPSEQADILTGIREAVADDTPITDLSNYIQKLAENFIRQGVTERDPLIDAVHNVLKDIIPDISRRQTMDAISGYGDFRPLNADPIKAILRARKGEMQQVSKLEDLLARVGLKRPDLNGARQAMKNGG
jgi:hypothetical protein